MHSDVDRVERVVHAAIALGALGVLSPVLMVVAVAVRLGSAGPVLHPSVRVGRNGRPFTVYKFRTMVVDGARRGPGITASGDPRITPIGRILRGHKLDELPQLWNVARGEMRLVGPRPEDPRFVALYSAEQRSVLSVCPGITGPAQLTFFDEEAILSASDPEATYVREILPRKLAIDMEYVRHRTPAADLKVLLRTLRALVAG